MRKKAISLLLSAFLLFSFASCGRNSQQVDATVPEDTSLSAPVTEETTETTTAEATTIGVTRVVYPVLSRDESNSYSFLMSEYSTTYKVSETERTVNLETAVSAVNNIVLQPGDIFSFNQIVGKRTITRGYRTAKVIINGEFDDGLGGGVCQVSSTLFNAVLLSNLEIVERTNHSVKIGYVPVGYDATVQWNTKDFQFKNNYDFPVKVTMNCGKGRVWARIYSQNPVTLPHITFSLSHGGDDVYTLVRLADGAANFTTKSKYKVPGENTTKRP